MLGVLRRQMRVKARALQQRLRLRLRVQQVQPSAALADGFEDLLQPFQPGGVQRKQIAQV